MVQNICIVSWRHTFKNSKPEFAGISLRPAVVFNSTWTRGGTLSKKKLRNAGKTTRSRKKQFDKGPAEAQHSSQLLLQSFPCLPKLFHEYNTYGSLSFPHQKESPSDPCAHYYDFSVGGTHRKQRDTMLLVFTSLTVQVLWILYGTAVKSDKGGEDWAVRPYNYRFARNIYN